MAYTGETKNGIPHGKGKWTYSDGSVYEGEWKDGKWHGKGKRTYSDGTYYEGEWKDDKWHGKGKRTYSSGAYYEGEWQDDKYHGMGKYTYSDVDYYEGEWKDGKEHGKGKYVCKYYSYEGEWLKGKRNGEGKLTYSDGSVWYGIWKNGKKVKELPMPADMATEPAAKPEVTAAAEPAAVETPNAAKTFAIIVCRIYEEAEKVKPSGFSRKELCGILECDDFEEECSGEIEKLSKSNGIKIVCLYDGNAFLYGSAINDTGCKLTNGHIYGDCIICAKDEYGYAPLPDDIIGALING